MASDGHGTPQNGKALFAWIKKQDEQHGFGLLKTVSDWAKRQDFPARMVQWNAEQVQSGFTEAQAAIRAMQPAHTAATSAPAAKGNGWNGSKAPDSVVLAENKGLAATQESRTAPAPRRNRGPDRPLSGKNS